MITLVQVQRRIQAGGWGGCNPLLFRRRQGNSTENERSHALNVIPTNYPGSSSNNYTGNDCSIPASRICLVNIATSAQIGRVAANT